MSNTKCVVLSSVKVEADAAIFEVIVDRKLYAEHALCVGTRPPVDVFAVLITPSGVVNRVVFVGGGSSRLHKKRLTPYS